MLTLKRLNVPLDRDVIFLAEAGEEGTTRPGIDHVVGQHFAQIDAEYCLAEGGTVRRENGTLRYASIGVLEKVPRTVELTARGPSAHGSVPRLSNAVARLSRAITALSDWQPAVRLNEVTREQFRRMASLSPPEEARHLRAVLSGDRDEAASAARYLYEHLPEYAALLRTSVSPTIVQGGMRYNVVPSEAKATLDVRLLPDENPDDLLRALRQVVNDPAVDVSFAARDGEQRPPGGTSINTDAFRIIERAVTEQYKVVTVPTMSTGASDKAQVRSKGVQCYGVGPAVDVEDAAKGFGAHADQERILERDLHDFVRFYWDVVTGLAAAR
jgi:acetylornithine deacetylase/succinyl-diaminopimelate desuccinylase-like protein